MSTINETLRDRKYSIIFGVWLTITGVAVFRITRQPYSKAIKADQIETIFKGTSLLALIAGIAAGDFWAGYISGAVGIIIGNPLDIIKVRLQGGAGYSPSERNISAGGTTPTRNTFTSPFTTASSLVRGAAAPILGYGALNALLFVTYNRSALLLNGADPLIHPANLSTTFVAGVIGGLATWIVSTPTELIKCRAQMSTVPISNMGIIRELIRIEGVRGLYFGGTVTAIRDSIGYGFYFWSYELGNRLLSQGEEVEANPYLMSDTARTLLCGGLAGVVTWASIFPLDVVKTRIQTQLLTPPAVEDASTSLLGNQSPPRRVKAVEMAKTIYQHEGLAVFFRGLGVCSVRAFIVNAVQWAVYESIMKLLRSQQISEKS